MINPTKIHHLYALLFFLLSKQSFEGVKGKKKKKRKQRNPILYKGANYSSFFFYTITQIQASMLAIPNIPTNLFWAFGWVDRLGWFPTRMIPGQELPLLPWWSDQSDCARPRRSQSASSDHPEHAPRVSVQGNPSSYYTCNIPLDAGNLW